MPSIWVQLADSWLLLGHLVSPISTSKVAMPIMLSCRGQRLLLALLLFSEADRYCCHGQTQQRNCFSSHIPTLLSLIIPVVQMTPWSACKRCWSMDSRACVHTLRYVRLYSVISYYLIEGPVLLICRIWCPGTRMLPTAKLVHLMSQHL